MLGIVIRKRYHDLFFTLQRRQNSQSVGFWSFSYDVMIFALHWYLLSNCLVQCSMDKMANLAAELCVWCEAGSSMRSGVTYSIR